MNKMKFCFISGRRYCYLTFGLLLIGNVSGLFLAPCKDINRDLQLSTFNETNMGMPNIEKCSSQYKSQAFDYKKQFISSQVSMSNNLPDDYVLYFPMTENAGNTLNDQSGNGNFGNIVGATWTEGKIDHALYFDGNDHVSVPNHNSLNPTTQISILAWIKADDWDTNGRIMFKGHTISNQYDFGVSASTQTLGFQLWGVTSGMIEVPLPTINEWHHVAGVYDGSTISLYIDGVKLGSHSASGNIQTSTDELRIGTTTPYTGDDAELIDFFHGSIDEVRIYDRALSTDEVYPPHDPILIDGNSDFIAQATSEGWPGDGSETNPILIDELNIRDSNVLIEIRNTDLFFLISNCILVDGINGISLYRAKNGYIFNNTIHNTVGGNNERNGILLADSDKNIISNNTCYNIEFAITLDSNADENIISSNSLHDNINPIMASGSNNIITNNNIFNNNMGISLYESKFITFSFNLVKNNSGYGVDLQSCENSIFTQNSIEGNSVGFFLGDSSKNSFFKNSIHNNNGQGFYILASNDNTLSSNNVTSNDASGIDFVDSNGHTLSNNIVSQNNIGIFLEVSSFFNNIISNTITNNTGGLQILSGSDNNIIKYNNFINNEIGGSSQASDDGSNNIFTSNYWDDWTSPDTNSDGYVDDPYLIDGGSQDLYPLVLMHEFTIKQAVLFPNGGESLKEIVTIRWSSAMDSHDHEIIYSVYFSIDNGLTWTSIVSGLETTSYDWETRDVSSGTTYLIKVVATCTEGLIIEDTSDGVFTINNKVSIPTLTYPTGGEIVKGIITIQWTPAVDSEGHDITYSLYYSVDNGSTWFPIVAGLETASYDWNTRSLPEDSSCLIKVVATCSEGFYREFIIEGPFIINNVDERKLLFLISWFAFLAIIPELYLGKKFSNFVNRQGSEEGVETP